MSMTQGFWRALFGAMARKTVAVGSLAVIDPSGRRKEYGDGASPRAAIRLHDPALFRRLFLRPELAAGEAYMDGTLTVEEGSLADLLALFQLNAARLRDQPVQRFVQDTLKRIRRFHQNNTLARARRNAAHHYDLSNDLYRLFLDEDLNYSCAYFEAPGQNLEDAQRAKLRHIAAKLAIEPGMRVLDIGCGWGAMAFYLAEHCGARVVGVTLSREQLSLAQDRARARGLADRVAFRLADYRDVHERFDRIVSVGMFEHVGVPHYGPFFRKVRDLMSEDGVALLHSIGRKGPPGATDPWTRKYIFPGGYVPSLSETLAAVERASLWVCDIEILRLHYAETLKEWRRRFEANREKAAAIFDERFCRMWTFYLTAAELSFRYGGHMVFQMQLARRVDALPIRRDYMRQTEDSLRARETAGEATAREPVRTEA
ncbi:SAM-dependent methyltransferase [Amphiplicatus metriothermophilus]|uniref:Cyclopropane-fatty-acyl-phospholipid synthase n=1 Tax=Amphiplicatus metriothermophilus TaxID=1519374 RepID=A0A239PJJ2_9PROT|nr:cyclopropane-fatty-acyl-phospholipid synthase family protein [Amphiplicatus metriothermophilus]MBB5517704.1 cyclopropane-fatty-acyl-phospholipid synthase [Amphiplicatus metriothermophilus]SNT67962.1 cyclopropane-fatty-acyl-phospholipid synthase [Amphiplicatus metriothermophilus]